jgi:hypothetical protein
MTMGGSDLVDDWYRVQDGEVRGAVDALLEHLGNRHRAMWRRPQFDLLSGICRGLGEIRIKARSGEYRILGYFGPDRMAFTLLTCFKKSRDADTDAACRIGQVRRKEIATDVSRARSCSFP